MSEVEEKTTLSDPIVEEPPAATVADTEGSKETAGGDKKATRRDPGLEENSLQKIFQIEKIPYRKSFKLSIMDKSNSMRL